VASKSNYGLLLAQGTSYRLAAQISSATTVLPYIATELGGEPILIALLVPLHTVGTLLGTALVPKVLRVVTGIAFLMVAIAGLQALLTAVNATAVGFWCECDGSILQVRLYSYPLLLTSFLIGVVAGSSLVIYPMVMSTLLSPRRRSDLLLRQSGYGAALAVVVTASSLGYLSNLEPQDQDADLLWIGAAALTLSALCCLGLKSQGAELVTDPPRTKDVLRQGYRYLRRHPWLRRYVVIQLVFLTITLAPMFFAIYTATTLGPDNGDLERFLVFTSVGLLIGIPFWRLVRRRLGTRGMYVCSGALSAAAGILCIVTLKWQLLPTIWSFGLVLLLVAVANQGVFPAAQDWIMSKVEDDAATVVLSYSQILVSIGMIIVGFGLAIAAEVRGAIWPLVMMVGLAFAALLAANWVPAGGADSDAVL
jgi:MFS family permease